MAILASAAVQQKQETVNEMIQEAIRFGMQSGFSEPIINAVEETTGRSITEVVEEEEEEKSKRMKAMQGIAVFLVMFAVLYVVFRQMSDDE